MVIRAGRPTEAVENDCYLCESLYEESRRQIKKLPRDGLKKYTHGAAVVRDEIYFFRRPIQAQRVRFRFHQSLSKMKIISIILTKSVIINVCEQ